MEGLGCVSEMKQEGRGVSKHDQEMTGHLLGSWLDTLGFGRSFG